jgi:hypothetical protein
MSEQDQQNMSQTPIVAFSLGRSGSNRHQGKVSPGPYKVNSMIRGTMLKNSITN